MVLALSGTAFGSITCDEFVGRHVADVDIEVGGYVQWTISFHILSSADFTADRLRLRRVD